MAAGRSADRLRTFDKDSLVRTIPLDMDALPDDVYEYLLRPTHCIHLAWPGLPNYLEDHHIRHALPQSEHFLRQLVTAGLRRLVVAGTCFEYGMTEGVLSEDDDVTPTTQYGIAKNRLRESLMDSLNGAACSLVWARLFYLHGSGQSPKSLFGQLDAAIAAGATVFDMSKGEQIRDYLFVETAAEHLTKIFLSDSFAGIINICSGQRLELKALVKNHLRERGSNIELNLGVFPYPKWEPFRFWGSTDRLKRVMKEIKER